MQTHFLAFFRLGVFVTSKTMIFRLSIQPYQIGGGGGGAAELQKRLKRRERELRAAMNRVRVLEEASITQETERYQERQLLADVLKQNHLLPEKTPQRSGSERRAEVGEATDPRTSGDALEGSGDGGESSATCGLGVVLTADEALMGIQKLANLLRQLEEENRVLFLFAQMVFPTYPSFGQNTSSNASPYLHSAHHNRHARRPQLDFEELRTRWLELEEDRSLATVQAQQAALAHARQLEAQTVEHQKKIEDLMSTVSELRRQLGKVTKEKALLLVNHMQQRTTSNTIAKSSVSTEGGRNDILTEACLRGCPQCAAVAAAAAKAVEAASARMTSVPDEGDVCTAGRTENTYETASSHSTEGQQKQGTGREDERDEGKFTRVAEAASQVSDSGRSGEQEGSISKNGGQENIKSPRGGGTKMNDGTSHAELSDKENVRNISGVCTAAEDMRDSPSTEQANRDKQTDQASQKANLAKEVERLTSELTAVRGALQRHREQARELLGQKDEALKRVQQKLFQLQQRQKAAEQMELDLRYLSDGSSNAPASLGLMSGRVTGGLGDTTSTTDTGVLVQQLALRHSHALAEVQDQLQQAREEALRAQQEAERLRTKLEEQREEQQRTVSKQPRCSALPSKSTSSTVEGRSLESSASVQHHGEEGIIRDAEYLRNVLIRYVQYQRAGNEKAANSLLPVLATVLKMNEQEKQIMLSSGGSSATGGIYASVAQQLGLQF